MPGTILKAVLASAVSLRLAGTQALACTRAVYLGPEDRVLTGRTFDWKLPINSNLWVRATIRASPRLPSSA